MSGQVISLLSSCYNTTLNSLTSAKKVVSNCASAMQRIFYEHSIFFAMNNQAIASKSNQYKDLTWSQKFKIGVIKGIECVALSLLIAQCLQFTINEVSSGRSATRNATLLGALTGAIFEEVLFRGVLQNCLAGSQKIATWITPQCLKNNRIFNWLTSPSARIISINTIFAVAHLTNAGDYLSTKEAFIQTSRILLKPSYGILHETTGDIIVPLTCHLTNNFFGTFL